MRRRSGSGEHPRNSNSKGENGVSEAMDAPDDYELIYFKENVSVHPSQSASERIYGQLRLVKQNSSVFMTWVPYSGKDRRTSSSDRNLYTIRSVSLTEMKSVRRHTPPFGWQYIIVVLKNGLAFPPLYFHNGGVREFLAILREHSLLLRSPNDPDVYLINDICDPLQRSLTSLDITEVTVPNTSTSETTNSESTEDLNQSQIPNRQNHRPRDRDDFSMQVLERFSMVTKFARDTTAHIVGGLESLGGEQGKRSSVLPQMQALPYDLAQEQQSATPAETTSAEEGNKMSQQHSGDFDAEESTNVGVFELVDGIQDECPALVFGKSRQPALERKEWETYLDGLGRINDPVALKKRIFEGGIEPSLRCEVWKFLLEYYPFNSTYEERRALVVRRKEEYSILKSQWQSVSNEQAKRFSKFRERRSRIEKDVIRTDRVRDFYAGDDNPNVTLLRDILITYSFYNFDLGYCQGMSDLLSPILYIMTNEEDAFWSFAALMERLGPNFHRDQNGMHSQLLALSKLVQLLDTPLHDYFKQVDCLNYFFCFRWILIQFKREFEYEDLLRLWEVLWSRHLSEHFHLYMCVAILKRHRRKIMDEQMEFDSLLKFINELSCHLDLDTTLRDAQALCLFAAENGVSCIPPCTPPSLTLK